ncbi:MAG TPA: DUF2309 domain-containing protein [Fimbriiglobus sp.]|nr:DUF2309 domain-containing protein [Fimbriiglobus sp.]
MAVKDAVDPDAPPRPHDRQDAALHHLRHTIEHAAHLLPAQGPINSFIHHNTLHAFEELTFEEAVVKAGRTFGCQPYLPEDRFRQELARGRIRFDELRAVLREDLDDRANGPIPPHGTRFDLRLAMLEHPLRSGPTEEVRWFLAETGALHQVRPDVSATVRGQLVAETRRWVMRDLRCGNEAGRNGSAERVARRSAAGLTGLIERFGESRIESWGEGDWEAFTLQALWRVCRHGVAGVPPLAPLPSSLVRHRDLLFQTTGVDADLPVHELLIQFCAMFVDQGVSHWSPPAREEGFFRSFCTLYRLPGGPPASWRRGLSAEIARIEGAGLTPLESIRESLELLGVPEAEWAPFVTATLLALRGWAGITRYLEQRPDRTVCAVPEGSLIEYLAVRLMLDRLSAAHAAHESLGYAGPLSELRLTLRGRISPPAAPSVEQRAFPVFQLAQVLGWTPEDLHLLNEAEWAALVEEVEAFSGVERRRVFHLAYEVRFNTRTLDALAVHARAPTPEPAKPRFQAMFCIDEREESVRRHLEELAPDCQTFSVAAFYAVAMYYRGAADAHFTPLCPGIMLPKHWVTETVVDDLEDVNRLRARMRRAVGMVSHQLHVGSRGLTAGAVVTSVVGVLASAPLVARTLFPRLTARVRQGFGSIVRTPPRTVLHLERTDPTPGPEGGGVGYTLDEMTAIGERVLRDAGLTTNFARLVLTFGHGSTSMNNPHESAHDCGACGGARGGPNGRAIAMILNDRRVRGRLAARGIPIPDETMFVGGMHNTSSDEITYADLDRLPASHRAEFEAVRAILEEVCDRDAHERSRRFVTCPLTASFPAARRHVEGRAEDLSQVRPEWGHATNAITIVGRRARTRGLYLDRRAFLNSYDPTRDDADGTTLAGILAAAVPVCAGISLEYYFSYVDNPGYGCGTKLPHNITSLVGVMDGAASDLRTGLPWQMVELHEPVRQLFVIETTPETMLAVLGRNPAMERLFCNRWAYLAVLDPASPTIQVYHDGEFHPYWPTVDHLPRATSSVDWYRGWRDHLEFAQIVPK